MSSVTFSIREKKLPPKKNTRVAASESIDTKMTAVERILFASGVSGSLEIYRTTAVAIPNPITMGKNREIDRTREYWPNSDAPRTLAAMILTAKEKGADKRFEKVVYEICLNTGLIFKLKFSCIECVSI